MRGLGAELDELEREILEAYVPPRSIDEHKGFISLHASFKLARELNNEGYLFGALHQYLGASVRLGMIMADPASDSDREKLKAAIDRLARRLGAEKRDPSIAVLYLEMAESSLDDEPARARVITESVLPAYFAALEASRDRAAPSEAEVTVTLVRWPYT